MRPRRNSTAIHEDLPLRPLPAAGLLRERAVRRVRPRRWRTCRTWASSARSIRPAGICGGRRWLGPKADVSAVPRTTSSTTSATGPFAADDPEPLCRSCRLTRVIPDLSVPGQQGSLVSAGGRQAAAGVHACSRWGCPSGTRTKTPSTAWPSSSWPIRTDQPDAKPVLTGHADGVITINVAEADDAEREKRRLAAARAVPHAAGPLPPRGRPLLLGPADRGQPSAGRLPRAVRRRARRLRRRRCSGTTSKGRPPTGSSGSSAPTPARIRGKTGPRPGPTTCT